MSIDSIDSSDSSDSSDKPTRHTSKISKISFVLGAGSMEDALDADAIKSTVYVAQPKKTITLIDVNYIEIIYTFISTLFEF